MAMRLEREPPHALSTGADLKIGVLKLLASKIGRDAFQLDKSLASEADGPPQPHAPSALSTSL